MFNNRYVFGAEAPSFGQAPAFGYGAPPAPAFGYGAPPAFGYGGPAFGGPADYGYGFGPGVGMYPGCGPCAPPPSDPNTLAMAAAYAQANGLSPDQLAGLGYPGCTIASTARGRSALFGWDSGANCGAPIPVGGRVTLTNTAQSTFLIKEIFVTDSIAEAFVADSIKVGNTELLLTTGNISLSVFKSNSCFRDLKACIASPGVEISITVTNISAAPARFVATIGAEELPPGRCP